MQFFRYILWFTLPLLLASCEKDTPAVDPPRPEMASQTLLLFLAGQGNLVSPFDRNIANALKAITPDMPGNGRILVFRQTGLSSSEISELYYSPSMGRAIQKTLKKYEETLSPVDGPTVTRILNDMMVLSPARKYGLIMGSHAAGWVPSTHIYLSSIPAADGTSPADYWKRKGEAETRWFGLDNGKVMDIPILAQSLRNTGIKFEYLIFDACFMSSIEAIYDLRATAGSIIGSPCEIMLYGFPYDVTLPYFFLNDGADYNLQSVCESYHKFYTTTNVTRQSGCIALAKSAELEALADVIRRINAAGPKQVDPEKFQIYEGLSPHLFYDLGDYIKAACSDAALYTEFLTLFDRAFPPTYRLHTPSFYTDYSGQMIPVTSYSGVSVSEPSTKYTEDNRQTEWYKATHL